ncbi:Transposase [Jannaschia seosinensis]|uniref:Transposase n=1 Tax=Jannaschia seosinensis TaxID=313367 RepID=A0A0M7B3K7_9RHOB|nr:IS4 family transposase [Jannaschia seosinensis]CUH07593.1 Transposase [Jannaschia seosinensis]
MLHHAISALTNILRPDLDLSKSRLETLCMIVIGMVSARSVNLGHLACERPGSALTSSTYRRLQRFFQHVHLDEDWSLPLLVRLLGLNKSWLLALDRTNWQIGKTEVNFLVLAVVTRRFRVPLVWSLIEGRGCSDTDMRIALMERYLANFPATTIRLLLADREFVGAGWMEFLSKNNIPFAIRVRGNLRITTEDGHDLTLRARLRLARRGRAFRARLGTREDAAASNTPLLNVAAKPLKGEWLIVVTNVAPRTALETYRKRWAIECLFGDAKTRGLNLEDTRLTDPRKLALLMSLVALALAWAGRAAADLLGKRAPPRKSHGHYARSWFRTGFDHIRSRLRADPLDAIASWQRINPEARKPCGVV